MFLYVQNKFNPVPSMTLSYKDDDNRRHVEYLGAPLYLLPRTVKEYEDSKSSKYWKNIRRGQKQFESEFGKLEFTWMTDAEQLEFWLPKVHELFLARWSDQYISSPWKTLEGFAEYAKALFELAAEGKASLAVLYRGGELLAFSYNLHQENIFYFYQHATTEDPRYRKFSLGKIFLTQLLREVISTSRFSAFDFMVGEAGYKYEWADRTQRVFLQLTRRENESQWRFLARTGKTKLIVRAQKSEHVKNLVQVMFRIARKVRGIWAIKHAPSRQPALSN